MKILFFGTPVFAEIVLEKLLNEGFDVVGVVCQEDKPAGRGNKLTSPHIVSFARQHSLPVYQFPKLKEHIEDFKKIDFDLGVTASYGKILPKSLLEIMPCVNVHPSLLPKYRGATPIQTALLNGDKVTGVTIMKTEVGMDDGDIYLQKEVKILPEEDYSSLMPRLACIGAEMLVEVLRKIGNNTAVRTPQDHSKATFVKLIQKEDGLLDFSQSAESLANKVRAFCEAPICFFFVGGERIKVFSAKAIKEDSNLEVGQIIADRKRFLIQTKDGILEILKCQAPGGKAMDAKSFLNGYHFKSQAVDI